MFVESPSSASFVIYSIEFIVAVVVEID